MTAPVVTFDPGPHAYTVNGEPVPSVTQVLKILNIGALPWWGMQVGVEGVLTLVEGTHLIQRGTGRLLLADGTPATEATVTPLLTREKLTTNHQRDKAGTRGRSVHAALELYASAGVVPKLAQFPPEDRGYVQALAAWLLDYRPECLETEAMVGSAAYRFAGTYDLRARIRGLGEGLVDAKTSKHVYPVSHFSQLMGYEIAAVECGRRPADFEAVLRLGVDGEYEFALNRNDETGERIATPGTFLTLRAAYEEVTRIEDVAGAKRRRPRKTKAAA